MPTTVGLQSSVERTTKRSLGDMFLGRPVGALYLCRPLSRCACSERFYTLSTIACVLHQL